MILAQQDTEGGTVSVSGKLLRATTSQPLPDIQVRIQHNSMLVYTDEAGRFRFEHVPYGAHVLIIGGTYSRKDSVHFIVDNEEVSLGDISFSPGAGGSVLLPAFRCTMITVRNVVSRVCASCSSL